MSSLITAQGNKANLNPGTTPLVEMEGISKIYQTGTIALQDVNLSIPEGEFVSFVGPSGCGKSTIFRMIAGLGDPTAGRMRLMGMEPAEARKQSDISFVFQDATLLPWCKVIDNVTLPMELRKIPKKERVEKAMHVLEMVGLQDYANALPRQLSGGMKMRVSIARALASDPKLLLMDEPFGALDEMTRQTLQDELLGIWQKDKKMTVLFVTHNVFEAVYHSTSIVVMTARPGKIASTIPVPVPFPRDETFRTAPEFSKLVGQVSEVLHH
ncbi:nitrate/sulfonate/bicarbonate ABC transporter ATP-binding protein [Paenibacillus sp. TCA20]|uniref:ABC transporter ATP-binding protein n=1 Tax=Paenibacillus sp. TCA20 TaxID=1499968 RepID=UPI0004D86EEA|nr:ABC transporter ATP-binding protein [Paenibacillus sp. TCA20]GAK42219.1 nitrate/sulfonate/bicarbonate ABC transporter ATP-binding protein [Paenibacillus sp. TCA20]